MSSNQSTVSGLIWTNERLWRYRLVCLFSILTSGWLAASLPSPGQWQARQWPISGIVKVTAGRFYQDSPVAPLIIIISDISQPRCQIDERRDVQLFSQNNLYFQTPWQIRPVPLTIMDLPQLSDDQIKSFRLCSIKIQYQRLLNARASPASQYLSPTWVEMFLDLFWLFRLHHIGIQPWCCKGL